jgi:hypothetical protein
MTTHLPSDDRMSAWRMAGRFVCSCDHPNAYRLGVFDARECLTCGRLVMSRDAATELLGRAMTSLPS